MVVINRRKTCYMGPASPFASIPEDTELPDGRRDSVESGGSDLRSSWARGDQWVDPLVGEFTLISTQNYDTFLAKVGAGPLSSNMVLRARINLTIKQVRAARRPGGCTYYLPVTGAGQTVEDPLRDNHQGQVYQGIQHQGRKGD